MRRLFLACFAFAVLASCEKESTVDTALTNKQPIVFAPYAGGSVTKGAPVNNNNQFASKNKNFQVSSYLSTDAVDPTKYFGFNQVNYSGATGKWENANHMYWPNSTSTLHLGAFSPAGETFYEDPAYSYTSTGHSLKFGYDVLNEVDEQVDLMYSLSDNQYTPVTDETAEAKKVVNLHFKHALTQVGFTATKDADINVYVESIKVCNIVNGGVFTATKATDIDGSNGDITEDQLAPEVNEGNFGTWAQKEAKPLGDGMDVEDTNLSNYTAIMADYNYPTENSTSIKVDATTKTQLTNLNDVMMLLPQELTAWDPTGLTAGQDGTESYLAIKCTITHNDGDAAIVNGTIYVPFDTADVVYEDENAAADGQWNPGYKITYNLHFGGGYTTPNPGEEPKDPEPGKTPDPEVVIPTLREITYTVTVDQWIPVSGGNVSME